MNWQEKAKEIMEAIKKYREDNEGWKQAKQNKEVTVWWKPSPAWNGALYRSECILNAEPETVFKYIEPIPDGPRSNWDKAVKALELLDRIDERLSVCRTITHSAFGGLISSRDFVDLTVTERTDDMISTNAMGVEYPNYSPTSDHVRGRNYPCSIACYKIPGEPKKTRVESYLQSELGGMLPQSLVENALPSNILDFYSCLKKALKDGGHLQD